VADTTNYALLQGKVMDTADLPAVCAQLQTTFGLLGIPSHTLAAAFGNYPHGEDSYIIPSEWYDTYAEKYVQTVGVVNDADMVFVDVTKSSAKPSPPGCAPPMCAGHLVSSRQTFLLDGVFSTVSYVKMIKDTRNVTNVVNEHMFPASFGITYWQQYVSIREDLLMILVITILSVSGAFLIFMMDLVSMLILMALMVMNVLEIYGCLHIGGMTLNAVPLVNLIMAAGVSTEYFARIIYVFGLSTGTRDQRMVTAMSEMFAPVLHGGISTFLGIVLLAASEYAYFRTYYFNMYCLMVVIGLANGLILLPIVLSILGPNSINIGKPKSQFELSHLGDIKYARRVESTGPDDI